MHGYFTKQASVIAPCALKDGTVAMCFWMTRCYNPVFRLVLYNPAEDKCFLIKTKWLTTIICDPTRNFDYCKAER